MSWRSPEIHGHSIHIHHEADDNWITIHAQAIHIHRDLTDNGTYVHISRGRRTQLRIAPTRRLLKRAIRSVLPPR